MQYIYIYIFASTTYLQSHRDTCATNSRYTNQIQANQLTMNSMETLISEVRHVINLFTWMPTTLKGSLVIPHVEYAQVVWSLMRKK